MLMFLKLINVWWTCANSNSLYTSNPIANAIIPDDERLLFFMELSDWLESWAAECTNFGLSKQTFNALTLTLRSQSMMIRDLFADGFKFIRCRQLQSDPIERRFSQYRAMSGGRFLVSLREVQTSEKILKSRSLLKIGFDYWMENIEDIKDVTFSDETKKFLDTLKSKENEIYEVCLSTESEEVSHFIAGNIGRRILKLVNCKSCESYLIQNEAEQESSRHRYLSDLSRGGLTIPSRELSDFVSTGYALLDFFDQHVGNKVREMNLIALERYSQDSKLGCVNHTKKNRKFLFKVIVNTFYNNKQKRAADSVRVEGVKSFKKRQRNKE